jgi:O-antigen ligase
MLASAAITGPLPKAGVILVALCAAGALLATTPRTRAWAVAGSLVLSPVLLLADIWHSPQVSVVHRHPLYAAVGAVIAVAILAAVAIRLSKSMWILGPAAAVALPFRVPIQAGGTTSNLLVPLYVVVAAGSLAMLWDELRRPPKPPPDPDAPPMWDFGKSRREQGGPVHRALAFFVVLYSLQAIYSSDFEKALQQMVFFYVPFALLFMLLSRLEWTPELIARAFKLLVGLGVIFACIGFVEYSTKTILLNPKLVAQNDTHAYFTVNSVFFDPDIFGRFLALVMIGICVGLFYDRADDRRRSTIRAMILAVLWAGLVLTLSRSSLGAVLVGLVVLGSLRFDARMPLAAAAAVIMLGAAAVAITPKTFGLNQGLNGASSGRASLVSGGISLFGDRPLQGFGSGSFVYQYRKHDKTASNLAASHTIPITVAAEQGLIGEAAYLVLVIAAALVLLRGAREDPVRAGIAAAFVALVFHTMLYADFLEDPTTWLLLGIGVALAAQSKAHKRAQRRAQRVREAAAVPV